jgi:hypothetical protein
MEPTLVARLKSVTQAVVATTALVAAITSLVKTCDKRLEQASYETLSASIQDIQKDQQAIRAEVLALKARDQDGDGISDADELKMGMGLDAAAPMPSGSSAFGPYAGVFKRGGQDAAVEPFLDDTPATSGTVAPRPPPPSWGHVKIMADEL